MVSYGDKDVCVHGILSYFSHVNGMYRTCMSVIVINLLSSSNLVLVLYFCAAFENVVSTSEIVYNKNKYSKLPELPDEYGLGPMVSMLRLDHFISLGNLLKGNFVSSPLLFFHCHSQSCNLTSSFSTFLKLSV